MIEIRIMQGLGQHPLWTLLPWCRSLLYTGTIALIFKKEARHPVCDIGSTVVVSHPRGSATAVFHPIQLLVEPLSSSQLFMLLERCLLTRFRSARRASIDPWETDGGPAALVIATYTYVDYGAHCATNWKEG